MRLLLFVVTTFFINFCKAQNTKLEGSVLVNPEFKGKLKILDIPNGKVVKYIQHNFKDEDYLSLEIKGQNDSMFFVSVSYSLKGHLVNGWVKKSENIGVYYKYGEKQLVLYKSPLVKSKIEVIINKFSSGFLKVIDCSGKWLRVQKKVNGKLKSGWMPPEIQCANPYTSCT